KPKSDELENLESDLKSKTLAIADQALLHTSTESIDAQSEQESSNEPLPDIVSVQNEVASSATRPNYNILSVPINPKTATQRSRQVSMESLQTVGQVPPVAVLKTTETELDPTLLVRSRGETPEEKQQRKLAVKRYRQERRKKITGIPEDSVLDNTNEESEPVNERPREPEADPRDMVVEGLGIDSDDEIEVDSDLEDNFVEIAGGHTVEDEDTDEPDGTRQKIDSDRVRYANPREVLAQDKVLMMERFLYGDNERDRQDEHETGTEGDSDDEPGEATVLNRQFEKVNLLLMRIEK
ncbi:hypothetical protein D915_008721, partial [Fasciola hepatica]